MRERPPDRLPPPAPEANRDAIGKAAACAALAFAAWLPAAIGAGFSFDDREAIEGNPVVEGALPFSAAFERDYWAHRQAAGHFRPLASLALRFDRALWGDWAAGFHVTNVLLHALVVFLAALLLCRLRAAFGRLPWIGVALFAVHPVLADSVAWISGRSSMLSALPGLAAAWLLLPAGRARTSPMRCALLGLLGSGLSMLGKEDGALWALALSAIALLHGRGAMLATGLGSAAGLCAALALRAHALGSPWIEAPAAALADAPLAERLLVGGRGVVEALRLAVWPLGFAPSYAGDPAFDAETLRQAPLLGILGLVFWSCATATALVMAWRRRSALAASASLALLAWFPFLQLVPSGEIFAPRFLYLPLLFSIPLLHAGFELAFRAKASRVAVFAVLLLSTGAWIRGRVYSSRGAFRHAVLAQRPDDAPSWNDLGIWHEESKDLEAACAAWQRATRLDPRYSRAWSNLGRVELLAGNTAQATLLLERAAREGPNNAVAWVNLGSARLRGADAVGAEAAQRNAIRLAPGLAGAWEGLGRALLAQSLREDARAALERALELDPGLERARQLLAEL